MGETVTVSTIIANVTSIVTAAVGWVTQFVTLITGSPLLLMFVIMGFVGLGIGLIKRIVRL